MLDKPVIDDIAAALDVLRDSLVSESPETRRKAAMDILELNGFTQRDRPHTSITEAQLDAIGRVIVEIEKVSPDLGELERIPLGSSSLAGTA